MNKKLNKIGLLAVGISTSFVLGLGNVKAISIGNGPDGGYLGYNGSGIKLEAEENDTYKMTLERDVAHDIEIKAGEKVILDLDGHNLTNYTAAVSTIWVAEGAELTITGTGEINQKAGSTNSVIGNYGKLVIEGGTHIASNTRQASIYNDGILEFINGTLTTAADDVFGLTNVGTAVIKGGDFKQAHNFSIINNAGTMTIEGGKFAVTENNTGAYSLITNQSEEGATASLIIKDGSFKGNKGILYNEENDKVSITGGTFDAEDLSDLVKYIDSDKKLDENGQIVEKALADYTKVDSVLLKVESLNKEEYTEETYKVLETAIASVTKDLKEDSQDEVDKMAEDIEKAIAGLEKVEAKTPAKVEENKPEEKVPNTADDFSTNAVFGFVSVLGIGALSLVLRKRR